MCMVKQEVIIDGKIKATNDFLFKKLFGEKKNEDLLKDLLNGGNKDE